MFRSLKSICVLAIALCSSAYASDLDGDLELQTVRASAVALSDSFAAADNTATSLLPRSLAARGRIWDALVLRGDEDLEAALRATAGIDFQGRYLFEAVTTAQLAEGYVPKTVREAARSGAWEERVIANLLLARSSTFRHDNVEAFTAAWAALGAIPQDDLSLAAESARIEAFSYLVALHGMSRDTSGTLDAIRRQEAVEQRSGLHSDHVTTLYNLAMVFASNGERQTAETLLESAQSLPDASEPMNAVRLDYALGKILTQEGRHSEAVPLLASASARLARMDADHAMLEASSGLRLALAHSHLGNAAEARKALKASRSVELEASIRRRSEPLEALILANIDLAEGRSDAAAQSYRDHIAFLNRNEASLIRRERSDGMRAVALSEALYDARTDAAEARAEAAALDAEKARDRTRTAIVAALLSLLASAYCLHLSRRANTAHALEARYRLRAEESEKEAEAARDAARESEKLAVQGEQAKEDFIAMMGHETRTPLNGLIPTLAFIEQRVDGAELGALVKIARLSANNLAAMLDNVSVLTAHRAGRLPNSPEAIRVGAVLEKRVGEFRSNSGDVGLQFRFRDDTGGRAFRLDERKLVKCVDALLDNASRFTGQGTVAVLVQPSGITGVRIAVSDDGPGMEPATVERLLKPFEQADKSRTRSKDGLGIGLSVVDTLMEVMGGRMSIDTECNRGTTVVLDLPDCSPSDTTAGEGRGPKSPNPDSLPRVSDGPPSLRVVA